MSQAPPARPARPLRSLLFVPGHKLEWMLKATKYGSDGLIFDLEDAVPLAEKGAARKATRKALEQVDGGETAAFVRVNGWRTGNLLEDVSEVVGPGLDGVMLPKVEGAGDVVALDHLLTELESSCGLPQGHIEILPLCESAFSLFSAFALYQASTRVRRAATGAAVAGGDFTRALGLILSPDGHEGIPFVARAVLEARAAGIVEILGPMSNNLEDVDLLRRIYRQGKVLGAGGSMAIHPAQIPILHEVFTPRIEEVNEAKEMIEVMVNAIRQGDAAARYRGQMIDYAQVRTCLDLLHRAVALNVQVGEIPFIEIPATSESAAPKVARRV